MSRDRRDDDYDPDDDRVQDRAEERQRERADSVERIVGDVGRMLGEHTYPTTSEELATEYGNQVIDLPNETESVGDVFDRLVDERYESREEALEAFESEITGEAGGAAEYNEERELRDVRDAEAEQDPEGEP